MRLGIIGEGINWIRKQLGNRSFRILTAAAVLTGTALCAEFMMFNYSILKILRYLILLCAMFVIAWIDQHDRRIPNRILIFLLTIRMVLLVVEWITVPAMGMALLISSLLGLLIGGGLFLIAHFISRGGVGMGDVKLFAVIGFYVGGGSIMPVVFLSALSSALYSVVMLALKKISLKAEIPFAPFVLVGMILAMALGM